MCDPTITTNISCGDCNSADPEWATLNRGLLLCKDCCYIHRTLGPQFTRVKSLRHSKWHPNLTKMLYTLAGGPANHVWEYMLLIDPSKADLNMKPSPNDPLETKKRKFITAKHLMCQFVRKQKSDSLSNELHSTVRTSDIGTSLRLLASGGDPNFFHPVQGTRPLHVAARHGQGPQIELLFLHGAQTDGLDYLGQTPVEHALAAGHKDLALRLLELRYYLTDKLSYFVCSQMPDHSTSKHIIIPKESTIGPNRMKQEQLLRSHQPHVLEQFAADLFDELDRRELESAMLGNTTGVEASKYSVAFLPVHSYFPSVRNQTRQKFARLTNDELGSLITLVLMESKRRHCYTISSEIGIDKDIFIHLDHLDGRSSSQDLSKGNDDLPAVKKASVVEDDDFPLYDNVASDDDLILTEQQTLFSSQRSTMEVSSISSSNVNPLSKCDSRDSSEGEQRLSTKLVASELKMQELVDSNENMKREIGVLQQMVAMVISENLELRKAGGRGSNSRASPIPTPLVNGHSGIRTNSSELFPMVSKPPRPVSMCDTRNEKPDSIGIRSNSTELYLQKKHAHLIIQEPRSATELVQDTTRKVVELIKVLIEQANVNDTYGIQFTCNKIHEATHHMAITLIHEIRTKDVQDTLEHVLFQVLRMKSEIDILISQPEWRDGILNRNRPQSPQSPNQGIQGASSGLVQRVKHICFDVGAAMKQLVSRFLPPQQL